MPRLSPDRKNGLITRSFSIPPDLFPYVLGAFLELADVRTWRLFGNRTPEECADIFSEVLGNMQNVYIGSIFPTIGSLPPGCLWCDGASYSPDDYPELYAVLDAQFKLGGVITLPNLDQRFLYGSVVSGITGGEAEHTLTILEIPSHSHNGHTHIPGEGTGELPTPIPDMPIPDPLGSAGGGLPHNNLPPYFTVKYYIVAR